MTAREIITIMIRLFPSVLGTVLLIAFFTVALFDFATIPLSYVGMLLLIAFACTLSTWVFYSKKELSKRQMMLRYAIQLIVTLIIVVTILPMGWPLFQFRFLVVIIPLHIMAYCFIIWLGEVNSKKLSDKFNERLKDYHREIE